MIHTPQRLTFGLSIAVLVCSVMLFSIYAGRGWIRASLLPSFANHVYRPGADKAFNATFPPITAQLQALGFTQFYPVEQAKCDINDPTFELLSETVDCYKGTSNVPQHLTETFRTTWQRRSPQLEQYLFAHGWKKQYLASQPIAGLFTTDGHGQTIAVDYSKDMGHGIYCGLGIAYTSSAADPHKISTDEICAHNLVLFGGSDG